MRINGGVRMGQWAVVDDPANRQLVDNEKQHDAYIVSVKKEYFVTVEICSPTENNPEKATYQTDTEDEVQLVPFATHYNLRQHEMHTAPQAIVAFLGLCDSANMHAVNKWLLSDWSMRV